MRRRGRAGRQQNLPSGPDVQFFAIHAIGDADGAAALEQDTAGHGMGDDMQVGPAPGVVEVTHRGPAPEPLAGAQLMTGDPFGGARVVVLVLRQAGLLAGLQERL